MPALNLDSCLARYRRAEEHVEAIEHAIAEWNKGGPLRLVPHTNAESTRHSLLVRIAKAPDLLEWSLMACDAFNGFRSSLDHLVYAVAVKQDVFALPDAPKPRQFAFPICTTKADFEPEATRFMPKLSDHVRAAVELVQPYKRQHRVLPPPLLMLRDFDNLNKHRLLQLAVARTYQQAIENVNQPVLAGETIEVKFADGEIADGTEVSALIFPKPTPGVEYKFTGSLLIALEHDPGPPPQHVRWTGITMLLAEIANDVWRAIQAVKAVA